MHTITWHADHCLFCLLHILWFVTIGSKSQSWTTSYQTTSHAWWMNAAVTSAIHARGPFHYCFPLQFKFNENFLLLSFKFSRNDYYKICTCHDSCAFMACAKVYSDLMKNPMKNHYQNTEMMCHPTLLIVNLFLNDTGLLFQKVIFHHSDVQVDSKHLETEWCIFASPRYAIISSENGLLPGRC